MASTKSPESPSKKRKQLNGGANLRRDKPVFTSRAPIPTLQQPPDFLTDSLNTSHIPSPSPTKGSDQPNYFAKPRQEKRRKPAGSSKVSEQKQDQDEVKGSAQLPLGGHRNKATKTQSPVVLQNSPPRSDPDEKRGSRVRTPTPPRGRQISENSPATSDPSPGRGYTEAYQRIVDEETLAHEESIGELDMDDFDPEYEASYLAPPASQSRLKSMSPSPSRLQHSHGSRSQNDPPPANDKEQNEPSVDEVEDHSGRGEDEDTTKSSLDSNLSQYQKDIALVNILKNKPKAFSKARMGENSGLTLENLRRKNGSNESLHSSRSAGSFSLPGSEPSMNIPKAWGRKARPGNDWLSRINEKKKRRDQAKAHSERGIDEENGIIDEQRQKSGDDIDEWIAAATNVPLPDSSSAISSSHSTPRDQGQREPLSTIRQGWNVEDDFTGRSLQVSDSPPLRMGRGGLFDTDTSREIKNIERRAVTTNRLGQLRERQSETDLQERINVRIPSQGLDTPKDIGYERSDLKRMSSDPGAHSKYRDVDQQSIDSFLSDVGDPIANTPVVIYKSRVNGTNGNTSPSLKDDKENQRPSGERKDSHDLLKRLSRASQSPSPEKDSKPLTEKFTQPSADGGKTPQVPKTSRYSKTPVVTGAWIDQTPGPTPNVSVPAAAKNIQTPHITAGGWIDTPAPLPQSQHHPSNLSDIKEEASPEPKTAAYSLLKELGPHSKPAPFKSEEQDPLPYSGPPLPKSALSNILARAKGEATYTTNNEQEDTLQLGDSTIQDLADLISTNETTILPAHPLSPPASPPLDPKTKISDLDVDSQAKLLDRLQALGPSLRDSKRQLASLSQTIS